MYDFTNKTFTVTVCASSLHSAIQKYYEIHNLQIIKIELISHESLQTQSNTRCAPSRAKLSQTNFGSDYGC